jgi:hypothetical protein
LAREFDEEIQYRATREAADHEAIEGPGAILV